MSCAKSGEISRSIWHSDIAQPGESTGGTLGGRASVHATVFCFCWTFLGMLRDGEKLSLCFQSDGIGLVKCQTG